MNKLVMVLVFLSVALSKANPGFLQVHGVKKIHVSQYELTLTQAYATCKRYGWTLATEQSVQESVALNTTLISLGYDKFDFWLGGVYQTDGGFNSIWLWLETGKEIIYENWNKDQPTTKIDNTDAILRRSIKTYGGHWSSAPSTNQYRFICEVP